jgi:hypothetical protein
MCDKGQGVPQDYATALGWYRNAAERGNTVAQNILGGIYALGQGVPEDCVIAHMWFNLAAARWPDSVAAALSCDVSYLWEAVVRAHTRQGSLWPNLDYPRRQVASRAGQACRDPFTQSSA